MSSYIIAGSADSLDTAYCQEIARRITSKYKNIDIRIVIKHPSEWDLYLQEICRIYGFLKKSNPIVYTFDGKIIGGRENFIQTASKYFGLDEEELIVKDVSSKINMKLAEEDIRVKKIAKSGAKTYLEKIDKKYKDLLAAKVLKHNLKQKETFLVNGVEYIHRELDSVPIMKFTKNAEVPLAKQEIVAQDINLAALSLNDQIKPQEVVSKDAFVTDKEKHPPSEQDRISQATKSNKMHQSGISQNKDSKGGVKESNHSKLRIDEQNDDVPDYVDYPFAQYAVTELSDHFYVAFDPKSIIGEEMIFYYNEDQAGNTLRLHNDGRPIKGHRVLIKEVHYDNQNNEQDIYTKNEISQNQEIEDLQQRESELLRNTEKAIKTEPNIPAIQSQKNLLVKSNKQIQQDAISQPQSDLNLISHLNHHTLYIHKPLSVLQLKNVMYFIHETDTIGTLQFLPENPNPRVKIYQRKCLLGDESNLQLPTEKFIEKQLEQGQFTYLSVPSEKGVLITDQIDNFKLKIINHLGFSHFVLQLNKQDQQKVHKIIKYTIDHILAIQEEVKHDIGYNLIFTKKRIVIVPLVEPYEIYNGSKLYLDGLAFLGYVHTARLQKSYEISKPKVGNQQKGAELQRLLANSTYFQQEE